MRATILPYVIILTKAHRAAVSMMAKGSIVASEVFLISTTQLYQYLSVVFFYLHYLLTSLKYPFLNTPTQQYIRLLTCGGLYIV